MDITVTISTENSQSRLELWFTGELTSDLSDYLKTLGFKPTLKDPMCYYADRHPAYLSFAEQLQQMLLRKGTNYRDIVIPPSFSANDQNIDHDKFSYVTISYTRNRISLLESYVVFEPYLKLAVLIANRFGQMMYGDRFISAAVKARVLKGKCRKLLTRGKVITAELLQKPYQEQKHPENKDTLSIPMQITEVEAALVEDIGVSSEVIPKAQDLDTPLPPEMTPDPEKKQKVSSILPDKPQQPASSPGSELSALTNDKDHSTQKSMPEVPKTKEGIQKKKTLQNNTKHKKKAKKSKKQHRIAKEKKGKKTVVTYQKSSLPTKEHAKREDQEHDQSVYFDIDVIQPNKRETQSDTDSPKLPIKGHCPIVTVAQESIQAKPSDNVRSRLSSIGILIPFTVKQAIDDLTVMDLAFRWKSVQDTYLQKKETAQIPKIQEVTQWIAEEQFLFQEELFSEILTLAHRKGYPLSPEQIDEFRVRILPPLLEGRMLEQYPHEPVKKMITILMADYFSDVVPPKTLPTHHVDYLDKVIAIMHDHYIEARRLSRKKIEAILPQAGVPNIGMLWEAVELSWLLWYKMLNSQPTTFDNRLRVLTRFWDTVQPTYAYSDSSKEIYKQYSTPCPIGAIIAEYTQMASADSIFEPSAGNGLLIMGADPKKTHVNEIDHSRRKSLEYQGFKTITHWNASAPFPKALERSFDVVVTNPPFAAWEAPLFDKKRILRDYFNNQQIAVRHMRLEHLMVGLALHTLKDSGKAAMICMGHISFGADGHITKYPRFFNWLYRHYRVDDIINLNSFVLYNKQGTVKETMLILISGRKSNPKGAAPRQSEASYLADRVDSFQQLWHRVSSHIKSPLEVLIQKLKIEHKYDIF